MSNAMRMGKRTLAGVAAGALALGALSIAGATSASAKPSIKPKVTPSTTAASVGPVRYSTTTISGTATQDAVQTTPLLFKAEGTDDTKVTNDDTIVVTITTAPSGSAKLWLDKTGIVVPSGAGSADDTLTTATGDDTTVDARLSSATFFSVAGDGDDTTVATTVGVSEGGVYGGTIKIYDGSIARSATGALIQTTTFSFVTAGKPTTLTMAPASLTMTANASGLDVQYSVASVTDSTGALTQIGASNGDAFAVASSVTGVATVAPAALTSTSFDDTTAVTLGTALVEVTAGATVGASTVSVTPVGTLPTSGVAAKSVAVTTTAGGAVAPTALTMTSPTSQYLDDTNTDDTKGYTVNSNLVKAATVTGTGATAGASQVVSITLSSGWTGLVVDGVDVTGSGQILVFADAAGNLSIPMSWTTAGGAITISTGATTKTKWVVINPVAAVNASTTSPKGTIVVKTGEAQPFGVTLVDSFGNPYVGYRVTGKATGTVVGAASAVGTTGADGKTTVSVPAPSATYTGAATIAFTILTPGGGASSLTVANVTASYTASGGVTAISVQPTTQGGGAGASAFTSAGATVTTYAAITTPGSTGVVGGTASDATYAIATTLTTGTPLPMAKFVITTTPGNASVVTVPEGVKVSATAPTAATLYSGGATTATIAAGGTAYVWATKTGTHDISVASGGLTATGKLVVTNSSADAYDIVLTPASQTMKTGAFATQVLTVKDAYGNVVDTTDDTGAVTMSITGQVLFGGYVNALTASTGTAGTYTATLIAGSDAGTASITAVPKTSNTATAWKATYVKPAGFAAPVTSAAATVTVEGGTSIKSISISGSRTTVSGKPGIEVDGVTSGIENGKTVIPYFRFPGQTEYTQGSARPAVSDGSFTWSRKTGKKIYVYVTNDDGAVSSNRIIIAAS